MIDFLSLKLTQYYDGAPKLEWLEMKTCKRFNQFSGYPLVHLMSEYRFWLI